MQLQSVWQSLDGRRRVIVLLATAAMFVAVLGLSRLASTPSMSLLYAGLESRAAGDVVRALDQQAVAYQVRGNAIWVDSSRRDSLRMTLAAQGLPPNNSAGYELLDGLSGFGTTSQMFDAAYWRAKEGELARTIVASPDIRSARVHISSAQPQEAFAEQPAPTASVTVTTAQGPLPRAQVKALRFLVASAVAGMQPENVAVIDSVRGLVEAGGDGLVDGAADDKAAELKHNVERLLAARVGPGHSVVEVSVERDTKRESIVENSFDPKGRVPISSDTQQRSDSTNGNAGAVTVASNLPTGDAGTNAQTSQSTSNETHERVNYEVSRTRREVQTAPGAIRRVTVAVLVDGMKTTGADGAIKVVPRPETELTALHDLVASAVGYDKARGDVITIKSMAFQSGAVGGTGAAAGSALFRMNIDAMTLIQLALLAVVVLALGIFVVRPILASSGRARLPELAPPSMVKEKADDGGADAPPVLTGEIDDGDFMPGGMAVISDFPDFGVSENVAGLGETDDPVSRLRRLIEERQEETAEILRSWMEDREGAG